MNKKKSLYNEKNFFQIWRKALVLSGHPQLKPPILKNSFLDKFCGEIAYFNFENKLIYVNLRKIAQFGLEEHILEILLHEICHYCILPFEYKLFMLLSESALSGLFNKNKNNSLFICNIFCDIIINNYIFNSYERNNIAELYRKISNFKINNSTFWHLYMRVYEKLWNTQILKKNMRLTDKNVKQDIERIEQLILAAQPSTYIKDIKNFSQIIEKYLDKTTAKKTIMIDDIEESDFFDSSDSSIFKKIINKIKRIFYKKIMKKNFQNDLDELAQKQKKIDALKGLIRYFPGRGDKHEYIEIKEKIKNICAGIGITDPKKISLIYYNEIASKFEIRFPFKTKIKSKDFLIPIIPDTWGISDPIEALDIPLSLKNSPVIIPDLTARQRENLILERRPQYKNHYNDLLIVLDSSGSTPHPITDFSFLLLSALIISNSAINIGCKVNVINFSGTSISTGGFTNDKDKIFNILSHYYGGGTVLPCQILKETINNYKNFYTVLITDTYIYNLKASKSIFQDLIIKGAGGTIFSNVRVPGDTYKFLTSLGWNIYKINSFKELIELSTQLAENLYSYTR